MGRKRAEAILIALQKAFTERKNTVKIDWFFLKIDEKKIELTIALFLNGTHNEKLLISNTLATLPSNSVILLPNPLSDRFMSEEECDAFRHQLERSLPQPVTLSLALEATDNIRDLRSCDAWEEFREMYFDCKIDLGSSFTSGFDGSLALCWLFPDDVLRPIWDDSALA